MSLLFYDLKENDYTYESNVHSYNAKVRTGVKEKETKSCRSLQSRYAGRASDEKLYFAV